MKKSKTTKNISFRVGGRYRSIQISQSGTYTSPLTFNDPDPDTGIYRVGDKLGISVGGEHALTPLGICKELTKYLIGEKKLTRKQLFNNCMDISGNNKIEALAWVHKYSEARKVYDLAKGIKRKKK